MFFNLSRKKKKKEALETSQKVTWQRKRSQFRFCQPWQVIYFISLRMKVRDGEKYTIMSIERRREKPALPVGSSLIYQQKALPPCWPLSLITRWLWGQPMLFCKALKIMTSIGRCPINHHSCPSGLFISWLGTPLPRAWCFFPVKAAQFVAPPFLFQEVSCPSRGQLSSYRRRLTEDQLCLHPVLGFRIKSPFGQQTSCQVLQSGLSIVKLIFQPNP